MPNRIIRESLLDSPRYWSCTIEARELFFHLMLLADDFGCVSLAPAFLRRRCFETPPTNEKLAGFLGQLCDGDLLRRYEESGQAYAFIPRFKQRLQRFTLKHPKPPKEVLEGDDAAMQLFSSIKDGRRQATAGQQLPIGLPTVGQQLPNGSPTNEVEVEVKRREEKGREAEGKGSGGVWSLAKELGLDPRPGESAENFKTRVYNASKSKPNPKAES